MNEPTLIPASGPLREGTSLLDCIPDAVVIHDMDFQIRYVSPVAEKLFGWKSEEIVGCVFPEIIPIDFLQHKREDVLYQILNKDLWRGEVIHTGSDGRGGRVRSAVYPIRDGRGYPVAIIGVVRTAPRQERIEEQADLPYRWFGAKSPGLDERDRILDLSQDLICIAGMEEYTCILGVTIGYSFN